MRFRLRSFLFWAGLITPGCREATPGPSVWVIRSATIVDGTGASPRAGDVRIEGDRIVEVGEVTMQDGDSVVDAGGLVLAPGFIDTHSHGDRDLREDSTALALVSQGITTIIGGQDGGSVADLGGFLSSLDSLPVPVNVASYIGHGSIRRRVLADDYRRIATTSEVDSMRALVRQGMESGALGLSTGLEYDPGIYSDPTEVIALARESAASGGRYISHIRSEDRDFWKAIEEIIRIGREAGLPVQVSHAKLAMRSLWGQADRLIARLDSARAEGIDITADIYPYLFWQSGLTVLFPKRDFTNRASADFAVSEVSTASGLRLSAYAPEPAYIGKTVAEVAAMRGVDSVTALIDLIAEAERFEERVSADSLARVDVESVIGTSMVEPDVERIMQWAYTNFCTDGSLTGSHPRSFGSYPRIFGEYVRKRRVLSLEAAVHRATQRAALNTGLRGRGVIEPGAYADLVLFDPATIIDRATPEDPHAVSEGVSRVWVNGNVVFVDGRGTGVRAGMVLRRGS
ncbi:MAG: N-acyl-D-amino-acid deacylase family protein [Gemmatimonadota bacterium]